MTIASCFACIVLSTIKTEAGELFTEVDPVVELPAADTAAAKGYADTMTTDTIPSRIVEYPKWNVGTNILEWIGVMPDLKYTTCVNEVESGKHKYAEDKLGAVCQHIMFTQILITHGNDRSIKSSH